MSCNHNIANDKLQSSHDITIHDRIERCLEKTFLTKIRKHFYDSYLHLFSTMVYSLARKIEKCTSVSQGSHKRSKTISILFQYLFSTKLKDFYIIV